MIKELKHILHDATHGKIKRAANGLVAGAYRRIWKYTGYLPSRVPFQPTSVNIGITTKCNLRCNMCWRQCLPSDQDCLPKEMTLENITTILDAFPYVTMVGIIGLGEPLMHPQIIDILKLIKSRNIAIDFSTNAMALTEKVSAALLDLDIENFAVSIDGAAPGTFESIRAGAKYDLVLKNVRKFMELKKKAGKTNPSVTFTIVGMQQNIAELSDVVELAIATGVNSVSVLQVSAYSEEMGNQHLHNDEETAALLAKAAETARGKVNIELRPLEPLPQPCLLPWFTPYITQDGFFRACPFIGTHISTMEEWYNGIPVPVNASKLTFGNILDDDFSGMWNGREIRRFRSALNYFMKEDKARTWDTESFSALRATNPENYCRICQWRFRTGC